MSIVTEGAIQAVQRASDILGCFEHDRRTLTVAEAAATLGLNRSTVWRYLHTLVSTGLVLELDEPGRYSLGPRTMQLAQVYAGDWLELVGMAKGALVELRDATNETAALHVRRDWTRVVVSQVESRQELHRRYRDLGEPISLLAGAPSVTLLAWMPETERVAYAKSNVEDHVNQWPILDRELTQIRERGYAFSAQVRTSNVGSIAAPIFNADGSVNATVNATGPLERFDGEEAVSAIAVHVVRAAQAITAQLAAQ